MITFFTALYPEAKGLIEHLNLKQNSNETLYRLFEGEQVRLVITGVGMISAATAAARHFANYPVISAQDLVVNLGVAGLSKNSTSDYHIGDLFLASGLTEAATGRTFYPDLLYKHPFRCLPLITFPTICNDSSTLVESTLIDMEAAALYQALLPHFSPDRMFFFKVISDIPGETSGRQFSPEQLLEAHLDTVLAFTDNLHKQLQNIAFKEPELSTAELSLLAAIKISCP